MTRCNCSVLTFLLVVRAAGFVDFLNDRDAIPLHAPRIVDAVAKPAASVWLRDAKWREIPDACHREGDQVVDRDSKPRRRDRITIDDDRTLIHGGKNCAHDERDAARGTVGDASEYQRDGIAWTRPRRDFSSIGPCHDASRFPSRLCEGSRSSCMRRMKRAGRANWFIRPPQAPQRTTTGRTLWHVGWRAYRVTYRADDRRARLRQ